MMKISNTKLDPEWLAAWHVFRVACEKFAEQIDHCGDVTKHEAVRY